MIHFRRRSAGTHRRRAVAASLLAATLSLLLIAPSSSAPGDPVPGQDDIPPGGSIGSAEGVVALSQGTVARASKTYITIGPDNPVFGAFYTNIWNTPVEDPTTYAGLCSRNRPCIPDPFYQPSCATDDLTTQRRGGYIVSKMYPAAPLKGGGAEVGKLADVPIRLAAFGSIPATATLRLTSPRVDGKVQPFKIHIWDVRQFGCDPDGSSLGNNNHALVEGKVEISIRDLRVDGVPVDLGSSCRTERPADLALWGENRAFGEGGYFPNQGGDLGAFDGLHPGSLGPLESPYYQEDQGRTLPASTGMTIPSFTGCGTDGDDLSPLVTAMASGPNNPIRVVQSTLASQQSVDLNALGDAAPPAVPERPPLPDGDER